MRLEAVIAAAAALCALLTVSGCDGRPLALPAAPTPTPVASTPPAPQPTPPATRTVSGSLWLHSPAGRQPLAGVDVHVWLERPRSAGPAGRARSDDAGRFSFEAPADAVVRLYARTDALLQPCLSAVKVGETEATVHMVAQSLLHEARAWPALAIERRLSGTIYEATPAGRQPSVDALVQVDGVMGDGLPLADTRTGADGRYTACGLEAATQIPHALVVAKAGFRLAFVPIPDGGNGPLDVELRACPDVGGRLPGGWCF